MLLLSIFCISQILEWQSHFVMEVLTSPLNWITDTKISPKVLWETLMITQKMTSFSQMGHICQPQMKEIYLTMPGHVGNNCSVHCCWWVWTKSVYSSKKWKNICQWMYVWPLQIVLKLRIWNCFLWWYEVKKVIFL